MEELAITIGGALLQQLVTKYGAQLLDDLIPHYPDADFSAIKRPDESVEDAKERAMKGIR